MWDVHGFVSLRGAFGDPPKTCTWQGVLPKSTCRGERLSFLQIFVAGSDCEHSLPGVQGIVFREPWLCLSCRVRWLSAKTSRRDRRQRLHGEGDDTQCRVPRGNQQAVERWDRVYSLRSWPSFVCSTRFCAGRCIGADPGLDRVRECE